MRARFHKKKGNKVKVDYKGLTEEEKREKRTGLNTKEYYDYRDASEWVHVNMGYIKFCVDRLLSYYKYAKYSNFKRDFHNEGVLIVLDRFPKYKPGLRGINSWLYQQIFWYLGKLIRRKYIRHYERTAGGEMISNVSGPTNPEDILIMKEEMKRISKLGVKLEDQDVGILYTLIQNEIK